MGELTIHFALMVGLRVAYATPLKPISTQKFADLKNRLGGNWAALLPWDVAINRSVAPFTVMTTEMVRNMTHDSDSQEQLCNLVLFSLSYLMSFIT